MWPRTPGDSEQDINALGVSVGSVEVMAQQQHQENDPGQQKQMGGAENDQEADPNDRRERPATPFV